jgi:hypothetical protein
VDADLQPPEPEALERGQVPVGHQGVFEAVARVVAEEPGFGRRHPPQAAEQLLLGDEHRVVVPRQRRGIQRPGHRVGPLAQGVEVGRDAQLDARGQRERVGDHLPRVAAVAAGGEHDARHVAEPLEHGRVALRQPLDRRRQPPQPITAEGVGAGQVEHEARGGVAPQHVVDGGQVGAVGGAGRDADVVDAGSAGGGHLPRRGRGDRQHGDQRVVAEARHDPVRRVGVEVDHHDLPGVPGGPRARDGDGDVVDGAEPAPAVRLRVVEAAQQVHRPGAVVSGEHVERGLPGGPTRPAPGLEQRRHRHPLGLGAEHAGHALGRVERRQPRGRVDPTGVHPRQLGGSPDRGGIHQPHVSRPGEGVVRPLRVHRGPDGLRDRQPVGGVVPHLHRAPPPAHDQPANSVRPHAQRPAMNCSWTSGSIGLLRTRV